MSSRPQTVRLVIEHNQGPVGGVGVPGVVGVSALTKGNGKARF